jgi:hypothetical protein
MDTRGFRHFFIYRKTAGFCNVLIACWSACLPACLPPFADFIPAAFLGYTRARDREANASLQTRESDDPRSLNSFKLPATVCGRLYLATGANMF